MKTEIGVMHQKPKRQKDKKDSPKPPEAGGEAQPSEAINPTDTLILDFWPPEP